MLLARPIYELVAHSARAAKEHALADVQGRYFVHRGVPVDIVEDDDEHRWVRVRDLRKLVPGLPRDEVLQRLFPDRAGAVPPAPDFRIRADALAEHLRAARDPAAVKLKVWVEREVLLGSRVRG